MDFGFITVLFRNRGACITVNQPRSTIESGGKLPGISLMIIRAAPTLVLISTVSWVYGASAYVSPNKSYFHVSKN
jgi:hypothetical protein